MEQLVCVEEEGLYERAATVSERGELHRRPPDPGHGALQSPAFMIAVANPPLVVEEHADHPHERRIVEVGGDARVLRAVGGPGGELVVVKTEAEERYDVDEGLQVVR